MSSKGSFLSVDVNRAEFGPVMVKAVYELYRKHSNCTHQEFQKTTFRDMVDFLRKLDEQPTQVENI